MISRSFLFAVASLAGLTWAATATLAHDSGWLPVGDGQVSSSPKQGSIYSCMSRFNGGGAHRQGNWVRDGGWNPSMKPSVDGRVSWPNARISITLEGSERVVSGNGLPTHETGRFPIDPGDDAYAYDRNPSRIREREVLLRLPAVPTAAPQASCLPMGMIAVAATGAALFNGLDGMGRDAGAHEILDLCEGHPDPNGTYHYHGRSKCHRSDGGPLAYALDGFGVYGMTGEDGRAVTNDDLDECHGHIAPVMWNGQRREIYHYHLTAEYPYSIGCFRGTPVSLGRGPGGAPGAGEIGGRRGQPPQASQGGMGRRGDPIAAVAAELGVDADRLRRAVGPPPPDVDRAARMLGIDRERLRQALERHRPR